ncbi:hypothetical protein Emed_006398 [Eimeria media]
MRLSLLALGALAGAPLTSVAFRVNPEAPKGGLMGSFSSEAEKAPFGALSLVPPSLPSVSFVASSPLPKELRHEQTLTLLPSRLAISALQQMTHRRGSSPTRPVVQQQPRRREFPPFTTPGAAPLSVSPELAGGITPAGGRVVGQPGRGHYPLPSSGEHLAAGAAGGPLRPTTALGYVTALAECAWPPREPPEEALSPEELKAEQEARAEQEAQFRRQIVEVVKSNLADSEEERAAAAAEQQEYPVYSVAMEALTKMTRARVGTREVVLWNIRDEATGKQVLSKCLARQIKILGAGAMAVVIEVKLVDEVCKKVLAMDTLAVKMMYGDPKSKPISKVQFEAWSRKSRTRVEAEKHPIRLIGAAAEPGQSVRDLLKQRHWVLPLYSSSADDSGQPFIYGGVLFNPRLLLSETMLADGFRLLHSPGFVTRASLPVPAREYVCGELIKAVARVHEIGLAHYDVKLGNILLGFDGSVNLGDFGVCRPLNMSRACKDGVTRLFADPEHAGCIQKGGALPADAKYDSWSLGMTCYYLITTSRFPYGIPNDERRVEYIASLLSRSFLTQLLKLENPEEDLRDAGASCLWAKLISELLIIPRDKRPTPRQILEKYPLWKFGTD